MISCIMLFIKCLFIIIPIITLPFLARTLGVEALGINSYTPFFYCTILTVISLLGMAQFGV